jgi:hypothetical protein
MADDAEQAIRQYLEWNASGRPPVRDEGRIRDLEQQAEQAGDVIEKLRLLSELDRVAGGDETNAVLQGFVDHARSWAEDNEVTVEAFRRLGVPDSDLRDAGLLRRGRRPRGGHRSGGGGTRSRVSRDDIVASLPSGRFTKVDLVRASGASPAAVTAALHDLADAGRVRVLGPDPDHARRGRAPLLYETT